MLVLVFLFALVGLVWAVAAVLRRETGSRIILVPFLLFCANDVIVLWPAAIYAHATGVSTDLYAPLVVVGSTFAFVAGYVIVRDMAGPNWPSALAFWKRPLVAASPHGHAVAISICAGLLGYVGYQFYQGVPPALVAIQRLVSEGAPSDVAAFAGQTRRELTKEHYFGGVYRGQGVFRGLMAAGWPLLAATSIMLFLQRRRRAWLVVSVAMLAASLVYIAGEGTRGPFVWAMAGVVTALSLVVQMRLRSLIKVGVALLAVLMILSAAKKFSDALLEGRFLAEGLERITKRILVGNGINTIHVVELVRSRQMPLRHGDIHRIEMLNSLPGVHYGVPFSHELFTVLNPAQSHKTTFSSTTYLGVLYADFGVLGAVGGYFLLGVLIALASQFLYSRRKTVLNTTLIGLIGFNLGNTQLGGPFPFMACTTALAAVAAVYATVLGIAAYWGAPHYVAPRRAPVSRDALWSASARVRRAAWVPPAGCQPVGSLVGRYLKPATTPADKQSVEPFGKASLQSLSSREKGAAC